ncbi:hypothetical protein C8Q77DRAFT_1152810 [Trametes polyzona]|nr:hypothetical protein C8Q77DRAFT_1152810 [Trametes polyzona]
MSQQRATDWRMELNNFAQRHHLVPEWHEVCFGPGNAPTWTASVFFNGVEYGRGSATNLGAAKEIAAEQAMRTLWAAYGR